LRLRSLSAGVADVAGAVKRVVVFVQENHTTDNYFRGLAPYGANVVTGWPTTPDPPASDQAHDRRAYFKWLTEGVATRSQFDTAAVLPYYLYLAVTGAFLENHCSGFGTNSTPNHLILVGGQTPTLKNPSSRGTPPQWDMPSVFGAADGAGVSWRAYAASGDYPVGFYTELHGSPNVVPSSRFVADAKQGPLPQLVYVWHNSPQDEHPPADVKTGMDTVWQSVDAVVQSGGWEETVFLLTWDDWGGWDDHVATPPVEYTPDNVQLAYGPRVPLLMFGGHVRQRIDSRWCSHASVPKTVLQLLGLPALGVPRVDLDGGLADLVDASAPASAPPPAFGQPVQLPAAPTPTPAPAPLPGSPVTAAVPVPAVIRRDGSTLPPPDDVRLPAQPAPPKPLAPAGPAGGDPGAAPGPAPPAAVDRALVVVANESTVLTDAQAAAIAQALQKQVSEQFGPAWAVDAEIRALASGAAVPSGAWILHLVDTTDQQGALGYHDEDGNEVPYARVFCKTAQAGGAAPSEVASHELLEMLADPHVSACALDLAHNRLYAWEVGDPCQGNGYDVGAPSGATTGIVVADFTLPGWMDPHTPATAATDYRGALKGPFALGSQGYVSYLDLTNVAAGWQQQLGKDRGEPPLGLDERLSRRFAAGNGAHHRRRHAAHR
jgi:hypothetical protein